jgi:hypothetical protein
MGIGQAVLMEIVQAVHLVTGTIDLAVISAETALMGIGQAVLMEIVQAVHLVTETIDRVVISAETALMGIGQAVLMEIVQAVHLVGTMTEVAISEVTGEVVSVAVRVETMMTVQEKVVISIVEVEMVPKVAMILEIRGNRQGTKKG